MKKILFMCLIALGITFISCTKQRDFYYVKYEVAANNTDYNAPSVNIELLTSDTIVSKSITGSFTEVYGPYKYHDHTYLKMSCNNVYYIWDTAKVYGKIYVSKNQERFVLKQEISTTLGDISYYNPCEILYIIDF